MTDSDSRQLSFVEVAAEPGVHEVLDLRSTFGFCAFHGGNLERLTDQIASEAAARSGASFYGMLQPKGMRNHIPSALIGENPTPKLKSFLDHCDVVVAIHGYGLKGRWTDLLFGGTNRPLAEHVARSVRSHLPQYHVIDDIEKIPKRLRGLHPTNPCNLPTHGGLQIELPPRVRGLSPLALYWPGGHGGTKRFPHTQHLIEGLIEAATSWEPSADE